MKVRRAHYQKGDTGYTVKKMRGKKDGQEKRKAADSDDCAVNYLKHTYVMMYRQAC